MRCVYGSTVCVCMWVGSHTVHECVYFHYSALFATPQFRKAIASKSNACANICRTVSIAQRQQYFLLLSLKTNIATEIDDCRVSKKKPQNSRIIFHTHSLSLCFSVLLFAVVPRACKTSINCNRTRSDEKNQLESGWTTNKSHNKMTIFFIGFECNGACCCTVTICLTLRKWISINELMSPYFLRSHA